MNYGENLKIKNSRKTK